MTHSSRLPSSSLYTAREGNNFYKCYLSYRPGVKRHPWFRHELKYSRLAHPQLDAIV